MADYEIEADTETDTIYMTLEGMLEAEDAEAAVDEVEAAIDAVGSPFYLINDISEFNPVSQEATAAIERGKALLAKRGVEAVVRVVGESVVGKMQFERVGDEVEADYHVATAGTVEDAEELLAEFRD
jgi:hypothetical protein